MSEKLIHFLRDFPDKWILFMMCILVGILFLYIRNDFASQLLNSVISALIGLLIGRSRSETNNTTKIDTDVVQTPSINNQEMNDTTINVAEKDENRPV